jgi:hypothetical protein
MYQVTAYQCDHCERIYSSQRKARRHERGCCFDVANHACATCVHLSREDEEYEVDTYSLGYSEVDSRFRKSWWCAAKEEFLYHLQRKCDKWGALPTGGANAYFAQHSIAGSQSLDLNAEAALLLC